MHSTNIGSIIKRKKTRNYYKRPIEMKKKQPPSFHQLKAKDFQHFKQLNKTEIKKKQLIVIANI